MVEPAPPSVKTVAPDGTPVMAPVVESVSQSLPVAYLTCMIQYSLSLSRATLKAEACVENAAAATAAVKESFMVTD